MRLQGFEGSYYEYLKRLFGADQVEGLSEEDFEGLDDTPEDIQPRGAGDRVLEAHVDNVHGDQGLCTGLGTGDNAVVTIELLLSALEACGVDNARIEIEGGLEVGMYRHRHTLCRILVVWVEFGSTPRWFNAEHCSQHTMLVLPEGRTT